MTDRHRIQIASPTGLPHESKFLLDGKEIEDLCSLTVTVNANEFIAVATTLEPRSLELDVGGLVERIFVSENVAQKAIGEQHAQRIAEVAGSFEPGSPDATLWQEIATVIYDLATRNRAAQPKGAA